MRFHAHKWNKRNKWYSILILTEDDIQNESNEHLGAGYEILILPSKYKEVNSKYLDIVRLSATSRCGEVIYI